MTPAAPWIIVVLLVLAICATVYDVVIHRIHRQLGTLPFASLWVAGGVAMTIFAAGIIVWIVAGLEMAARMVAIVTVCFIASGIPMLRGNIERDITGNDHEPPQ